MDDDFNTPQAVAVIFDFIRDVNKTIAENDAINLNFYLRAKDFLVKRADEVLGIINFSSAKNETNQKLEKDLINLLINLRIDAKKEKNFALADKIREKLSDLGIVLRDSKEGTTYKITNR
jgi:cysteinyl-tRNA synthetase